MSDLGTAPNVFILLKI